MQKSAVGQKTGKEGSRVVVGDNLLDRDCDKDVTVAEPRSVESSIVDIRRSSTFVGIEH